MTIAPANYSCLIFCLTDASCDLRIYMSHDYKSTDSGPSTLEDVSVVQCLRACHDDSSCVAVDYKESSEDCLLSAYRGLLCSYRDNTGSVSPDVT